MKNPLTAVAVAAALLAAALIWVSPQTGMQKITNSMAGLALYTAGILTVYSRQED